jgi:hypothetical protein
MKQPEYIEHIMPVSKDFFIQNYVKKQKPIIIKNLVDHWPALQKWSVEYFSKNFSASKVGMMKIVDGVSDLHSYKVQSTKNIDTYTAVASPIEFLEGNVQNDYECPEYCKNGSHLRSRIFIAPKDSATALHRDIPENIYVLVKGKKKIQLFSPITNMYPNHIFSKHPNFSKIDLANPDYIKFPKLRVAKPLIAELNAGDTLYIPSMWWHYVKNETDAIALNFWWSRGWQIPLSWATETYKKIIGV